MTYNTMKNVFSRPSLKSGEAINNEEIDCYIGILVTAFVQDPVIRWMYPSADSYLRNFPRFLRAFGGPAFEEGTALRLLNKKSCAIWLAPGSEPDEAELEKVLTDSIDEEKQNDLFAVMNDLDNAHPNEPHWYLPWLGTDIYAQGEGHGSKLLAHSLTTVDSDGLTAHLETPNPQTIPFYNSHGFKVVGESQHGACPVITFMQRPPRVCKILR